ncbi:sporulation protein YunB [Geobacillus stearothermophilus]|uniref:sporulation protein YunB n=1 Tax=Geobacillus stearothermophilus TaxID=1422 RepID=UPI00064A6F0E|nr:sporulation protein YunB [Geobacillus stearothermophilus]AKM20256.1 Sporulation protein YunB [Geobacillus sp. 12AMOR1]MED4876772.1 sporulation protein YunB [Anoxybacillus geothermalis]STO13545.1 sporulation protein YunB [[Flavobacterium] thermophilum]MDF9297710.1 sporulation protein YunB [Geobacillus stearothermophilus]MED4269873.1 sporulation protein YunB [Geobacillus stearothermophilus]
MLRPRFVRRGPLPFRYVFLLTFVFFMFSTAAGLWIVNKGIEPVLMEIAETETKRIANLIVNNALEEQFKEENPKFQQLVTVQQDNSGRIVSVDFNAEAINRILEEIDDHVMASLKAATEGRIERMVLPEVESGQGDSRGIIYYIPLGQVTNNALLANLGPRVPVQFQIVGNVNSEVTKEIRAYDINSFFIEIDVHVEVDIQVVIPFASKLTTVKNDIPVVMRFIPGEVPQFYNKNGGPLGPSVPLPKR